MPVIETWNYQNNSRIYIKIDDLRPSNSPHKITFSSRFRTTISKTPISESLESLGFCSIFTSPFHINVLDKLQQTVTRFRTHRNCKKNGQNEKHQYFTRPCANSPPKKQKKELRGPPQMTPPNPPQPPKTPPWPPGTFQGPPETSPGPPQDPPGAPQDLLGDNKYSNHRCFLIISDE